MRLRRVVPLTLAVLVGLSAAAVAQTRIGLAVGAGLAQPMGDFGDAYKTGWMAGAGLVIAPEDWPVGLRVVGTYGQFSLDVEGSDHSFKPIVVTGGVVVPLVKEGNVRPYVGGGAGLAAASNGDTETNLVWHGFGGLTFMVGSGGTRIFVEARWESITTEGSATSYVPVLAGLSFPLSGR